MRFQHPRILAAPVFAFAVLACGLVESAGPSILVPADVKVAGHLDFAAFRANPMGQQLVGAFSAGIAASLNSDNQSPSPQEMIDAVGFDPLTETRGITALCSDFANPKQSVVVIIELQKTTGNLAGLLLALPEYKSTLHRDYQIHSVVLDGDRLFGTIHTDSEGTKRIVAALSDLPVQRVLDHFDGQTGAELSRRLPQATGNLLDVNLFDFPRDSITEPPFSSAAQMIQTAGLAISDHSQGLTISLQVVTQVAPQAEQLQQMIQGGVAMLTSSSQNSPDPNMVMTANLLESLSVDRQDKKLSLSLTVPHQVVAEQLAGAMGN